jgi:diphthamide synthase (EF-2-diphthine--ammonia ligase)
MNSPPLETEPVYTEQEKEILKKTYPTSGAVMCFNLLPGHSMNSIYHMAQRMGLKNRPIWEEDEKNFLKIAINSGTSIKVMVEQLHTKGFDRSYGGTKQKVRELRTANA